VTRVHLRKRTLKDSQSLWRLAHRVTRRQSHFSSTKEQIQMLSPFTMHSLVSTLIHSLNTRSMRDFNWQRGKGKSASCLFPRSLWLSQCWTPPILSFFVMHLMAALLIACHRGNTMIVSLLLDKGVDVNAKSKSGIKAYDIAKKLNNEPIMNMLRPLTHGKSVTLVFSFLLFLFLFLFYLFSFFIFFYFFSFSFLVSFFLPNSLTSWITL